MGGGAAKSSGASGPISLTIDSGSIRYDRLVTFRTGTDGQVTALESNMAEFSRLQSAVTQDVLDRLERLEDAVDRFL